MDTIIVFDALMGTEKTRKMTNAEFAQHESDKAADEAVETKKQTEAQAKALLLDRLGMTQEEAKLLLS